MRGFTVWFTGLPCSGKSTVARLLQKHLLDRGLPAELLDGDEMRRRLTKGLGFTKEGRDDNIRRISFVANLLTRNGVATIACAISPYRDIREEARREIGRFVEVYVKCPLEVCISRDVKGMFQKAISGEIRNFTGISDPYEEPLNPEVVVETDRESPEASAAKIMNYLEERGFLEIDQSAHAVNRTIEIPDYIYRELGCRLEGSRFAGVSEYAAHVLSKALDEARQADALPPEEEEKIKARLKSLGYIE